MKTQCDVIVVGGGASGLLCAVLLAKKGVQVTVLEKNHRIGKKLSATGNGRCNFTKFGIYFSSFDRGVCKMRDYRV